MPPLFPRDPERCRPLRLSELRDVTGPRVGGAPSAPAYEGVRDRASAPIHYFATVPVTSDPVLLVSIFVPKTSEPLYALRGEIREVGGAIEVVTHLPAPPLKGGDLLASDLSMYGIEIRSEENDLVPDGEGGVVRRSDHKIGGRPYLLHDRMRLFERAKEAEEDGFGVVVQFDIPGYEDVPVDGRWPFGDGVFSLLGKEPFTGSACWRWYWDF